MKRGLIYRSTVRGFEDDDLESEPRYPYFGVVRRVSKDSPTPTAEAMFADLEELSRPRMVHGFLGEPVPGEPIERLEVYDMDSDDIIVMYRLPMQPVQPQ